MFRATVVGIVTLIGLAAGLCVGLLGGVALVEFASQSCNGTACGDMIVRVIIPVAGPGGALAGLSKGLNLVAVHKIRI